MSDVQIRTHRIRPAGRRGAAPDRWSIPSWASIGTADRVLPPAHRQAMATRANAQVVRVDAPHLSTIWDPAAVVALVTTAARDS